MGSAFGAYIGVHPPGGHLTEARRADFGMPPAGHLTEARRADSPKCLRRDTVAAEGRVSGASAPYIGARCFFSSKISRSGIFLGLYGVTLGVATGWAKIFWSGGPLFGWRSGALLKFGSAAADPNFKSAPLRHPKRGPPDQKIFAHPVATPRVTP